MADVKTTVEEQVLAEGAVAGAEPAGATPEGSDQDATETAADEPILSIRHLCKDFKLRGDGLMGKPKILHALSDVSLDVYEGETLGIIGESGCGKSTLGRCIVQLHRATSGEICYRGRNITRLKGAELKAMRKNIQMVFQDSYSSLDPRVTAARAIEEPLLIYNSVPDRLDPKIIVCDEPVSALDVSIQAQVLNLFRRLQRDRGLTYLFISHDLSVIKHISDRIAIMYLGRVVELCPAHQVYANPLHPYTKALLSAVPPESPFQKTEEVRLAGEIASPVGEQVGCPLAGRCPVCMERCRSERPALSEVEPGHRVACFRYHSDVG